MTRTRLFGLFGGLVTFVIMLALPAPAGMETTAWHVAAMTVLMAIWWMTEALPLTVTALLPFLLVPAFGVMDANAIAKEYYSPILFLILGGAFLALAIERGLLQWVYQLDHLYGLLLTLGLTLLIEGSFRSLYGVSGLPYNVPDALSGGTNLGFMFLPNYRAWVVVASITVCMLTWFVIEKTKLGAYLRAGTENPRLVEAFGVNVPVMITLTYAFGAALAAFAGVLSAPVYQVSPLMGQNLIIVVFAVVVIGGMGSIMGSILTGLGLGVVEGFTKVFYPEASSTVVFVIMVVVLLIRPAGLFGKEN